MKKGTLYYRLDCLNVLETLEDKTYSLIYLDIPSCIGKRSERVMYDESRANPIAALRRERGCKLQELSSDEIQLFITECENDRKKEYEKYLFKIIQNCFRVLTDNGVIVYREIHGEPDYVDLKHILDNLFYKFGIKVIDHIAIPQAFDLIHFYSKNRNQKFPEMYELQPLERYPYEDKKGRYRFCPLECSRNTSNFFEWNGFIPREGKGWGYRKEVLDILKKKGYIVATENAFGYKFPKLKYYREEHPVQVSAIWNDRNFFERVFDLFTSKDDKVLGIYESLGFAGSAEKRKLYWSSVCPTDTNRVWILTDVKYEEIEYEEINFRGKKLIEGKYKIVDSLQNYTERTYNEDAPSMIEQMEKSKIFFRNAIKEYEVKERQSLEVGNTIDEVLLYYIHKYTTREGLSISKFMDKCNVSRQLYYQMQGVISGKRECMHRERDTVLKIAVHTDMGYSETASALKLAGEAFKEGDAAEDAIIEWLCSGKKDIKELRAMIQVNCKSANWDDDKIKEYIYYFFEGKREKEKEEKKGKWGYR